MIEVRVKIALWRWVEISFAEAYVVMRHDARLSVTRPVSRQGEVVWLRIFSHHASS